MKYILFKNIPNYNINPIYFYILEKTNPNSILNKYLKLYRKIREEIGNDEFMRRNQIIEFIFKRKDNTGFENVFIDLDYIGVEDHEKNMKDLFKKREHKHIFEGMSININITIDSMKQMDDEHLQKIMEFFKENSFVITRVMNKEKKSFKEFFVAIYKYTFPDFSLRTMKDREIPKFTEEELKSHDLSWDESVVTVQSLTKFKKFMFKQIFIENNEEILATSIFPFI